MPRCAYIYGQQRHNGTVLNYPAEEEEPEPPETAEEESFAAAPALK